GVLRELHIDVLEHVLANVSGHDVGRHRGQGHFYFLVEAVPADGVGHRLARLPVLFCLLNGLLAVLSELHAIQNHEHVAGQGAGRFGGTTGNHFGHGGHRRGTVHVELHAHPTAALHLGGHVVETLLGGIVTLLAVV